jgi:murein L,D-transpeptidase YcbB/YkuD
MAKAKWRMAKSLEVLRQQIDATWPGRSLVADGGVGDLAHQTRKSDHNPNADGVVTARDFTNDPRVGCVSDLVASALYYTKDPRIDYIISSGMIAYGPLGDNGKGRNAWLWQAYKGKNPHEHHFHISVRNEARWYDDVSAWSFLDNMRVDKKKAAKGPDKNERPTIVLGTKGHIVKEAQLALIDAGAKIVADGWFGDKTKAAVQAFQRARGLIADGEIGPATWTALDSI